MLKRIYVNNFRSLVNFELTFDNINLILGHNGSGKSTVFEVIRKLQKFIVDDLKVEEVFSHQDLTKWQISNIQSFQLDFVCGQNIYKYFLEIEYFETQNISKMKSESLEVNEKVLFDFDLAEMEDRRNPFLSVLGINQNDEEISFPNFNTSRSIINTINIENIDCFEKNIRNFFIVNINPLNIGAESRTEDSIPNKYMSNFSAWYSHLSQSEQGKIIKLTLELQKVLTGFDSFQNTKIGEARLLSAVFTKPSKTTYKFNELSEGQKVLIALYTLLYCTPDEDCTLMIDEPENFLALPEIQPWLSKLIDRCHEDDVQAILISHHPSLINALATDYGYWFERKDNQAIRVQKIVDEGEEGGLSIAKLIEMKWIYDQ